jgi:hypothetical protein
VASRVVLREIGLHLGQATAADATTPQNLTNQVGRCSLRRSVEETGRKDIPGGKPLRKCRRSKVYIHAAILSGGENGVAVAVPPPGTGGDGVIKASAAGSYLPGTRGATASW